MCLAYFNVPKIVCEVTTRSSWKKSSVWEIAEGGGEQIRVSSLCRGAVSPKCPISGRSDVLECNGRKFCKRPPRDLGTYYNIGLLMHFCGQKNPHSKIGFSRLWRYFGLSHSLIKQSFPLHFCISRCTRHAIWSDLRSMQHMESPLCVCQCIASRSWSSIALVSLVSEEQRAHVSSYTTTYYIHCL